MFTIYVSLYFLPRHICSFIFVRHYKKLAKSYQTINLIYTLSLFENLNVLSLSASMAADLNVLSHWTVTLLCVHISVISLLFTFSLSQWRSFHIFHSAPFPTNSVLFSNEAPF